MNNKTTSINITLGTVFLLLFAVLLGWFFYEIRELLLIIVSAVIFSLALSPGKRFLSRLRIPEPIGVLLMFIFVFGVFGFFAYSFVPIIIQQYQVFIDTIPNIVSYVKNLFAGTIFENAIVSDQLFSIFSNSEQISDSVQSIVKNTGSSISTLFGNIINIILFFLLTFLFAINPKSLDNFLFVVTPPKYREYADDLWGRTKVKMSQWFQGQMILIFIIGTLVYFSLVIIGVPNALFLAVFAGAMEILPIFGPIIGAIPAVLMALSTGDATIVFITIAVFIIIQQLENTLIYPLVVSKVVGLSSVLIVLAIVIGGSIAGFVGVLIAVPIAGVIQELFNDIKNKKLEKLREGN